MEVEIKIQEEVAVEIRIKLNCFELDVEVGMEAGGGSKRRTEIEN